MAYWEIEITPSAVAECEPGDKLPGKIYAHDLEDAKRFLEAMHGELFKDFGWTADTKTREGEPTCYTLGDEAIFVIQREGDIPKGVYATNEKNRDRASRAYDAIMGYIESVGDDVTMNDFDTWVGDMICDLHHAAASRGLDMQDMMTSGTWHFEAEQGGVE